jgi:predicted RND superfamily exporter protein
MFAVKKILPLLVIFLVALYPLMQFAGWTKDKVAEQVDDTSSQLPTTAADVIVVVADFSNLPGDLLTEENIEILKEIDRAISLMPGLRGYSSLLSATVVKAEQDEILSLPFIPNNLERLDEARALYPDFPEVRPYLSPDFSTAVYYLEPGLTYPTQPIIAQLEEIQTDMLRRKGVQIHFTGLRPIRAYLERFLSQDLLKTLPVMFLLISLLYYLAFGNWRVLALAWVLKLIITAFAFACYRMFSHQISPMLVLIPTFNFGLLSDYLIHMFYHLQGRSGIESWRSVRNYLTIPLSLTALTSLIGFLSLFVLGGEGHVLVAVIVSISITTVYLFTLWWLPAVVVPHLSTDPSHNTLVRHISRAITRTFAVLFSRIFRYRAFVIPVLLILAVVAAVSLVRLEVQPYPLEQFPESSTVLNAERVLTEDFSGTVPFRLDIEADEGEAFLDKNNIYTLEGIHKILNDNPEVGFHHSILSVLKRINYYFHDSDPRYLAVPETADEGRFASLIQQYLLFYSASASPEEYESLIDSSFRMVSLHGILRYRGSGSLESFLRSLEQIKTLVSSEWDVRLSGPILELIRIKARMERSWYLVFGISSILIFFTVLIFFRSIKMSLISLIPSFSILLVLAGVASLLNIQVDEYTIIIVGISTGLTIDYTIHMLNTIKKVRSRALPGRWAEANHRSVLLYGYSLIRGGGLPVFFSFLSSILAFSALFFSSFSGAVHFALLLSLAIGCAFFIGVFLLPMFFVPWKGRTLNQNV